MNIKIIIGGASLFLGGGVAGYFFANKRLEHKWMQSAEEEIHASMKEFYARQEEAMQINKKPVVMQSVPDEILAKYSAGINQNEQAKAGIDISCDPGTCDDDDYSDYEKEGYYEVSNDGPERSEPYVIPYGEYEDATSENAMLFEKEVLCYYEEDEVLVDENEDIIMVSDTIGLDALDSFGELSEDPDIVYIRNEKMGTDYEVMCIHKSYQETVLGVMPEKPVKKRAAKRSRPKDEDEN